MNYFAIPVLCCALIFTVAGVSYFRRSRRETSKILRQSSGMVGVLAFLAAAQLYALSVPEIYRAVNGASSVPTQETQPAPESAPTKPFKLGRYRAENLA